MSIDSIDSPEYDREKAQSPQNKLRLPLKWELSFLILCFFVPSCGSEISLGR